MSTYSLPNRQIGELKRGDSLICRWGGPPRKIEHVEHVGIYQDVHVWVEDEDKPLIYQAHVKMTHIPTVTIEFLAGE